MTDAMSLVTLLMFGTMSKIRTKRIFGKLLLYQLFHLWTQSNNSTVVIKVYYSKGSDTDTQNCSISEFLFGR